MKQSKENIIGGLLRVSMGFIMIWPFFDKLFGLGLSTPAAKSWLAGGSPTTGFLTAAVKGPFAPVFHSMAGNPLVDWIFMLGLLLIGMALILGIGMKIAGYSGALMMFFMWLSVLFPETNPILDEHFIYLLVFLGFTQMKADSQPGLGKWWSKTSLVKKYPFLQ